MLTDHHGADDQLVNVCTGLWRCKTLQVPSIAIITSTLQDPQATVGNAADTILIY